MIKKIALGIAILAMTGCATHVYRIKDLDTGKVYVIRSAIHPRMMISYGTLTIRTGYDSYVTMTHFTTEQADTDFQ